RNGQAVTGNGLAIYNDLYLGLAQQQIGAHIRGSRHGFDDADNLIRQALQLVRVVAEQFNGQFALHAGDRFVDVVLDVLAELGVDAGYLLEFSVHRLAQRVPGAGRGPLLARLQAHAVFGDVPTVDIGAVIGTAQLADHIPDLGKGSQNLAHMLGDFG